MYFETFFDKDRDLSEVIPSLAVDLSDALQNGVIPDTGDNPVYNDIDSSEAVSGRVSDPFEAIDLQSSYLERASRARSAAKTIPSTESVNPSGTSD